MGVRSEDISWVIAISMLIAGIILISISGYYLYQVTLDFEELRKILTRPDVSSIEVGHKPGVYHINNTIYREE